MLILVFGGFISFFSSNFFFLKVFRSLSKNDKHHYHGCGEVSRDRWEKFYSETWVVNNLPQRKTSDSKSSCERVVTVSQLRRERGGGARRRSEAAEWGGGA